MVEGDVRVVEVVGCWLRVENGLPVLCARVLAEVVAESNGSNGRYDT